MTARQRAVVDAVRRGFTMREACRIAGVELRDHYHDARTNTVYACALRRAWRRAARTMEHRAVQMLRAS